MSEKTEITPGAESVQPDTTQEVTEAEPVEILTSEDANETVTVVVRQQSSPWAAAAVFITMLVLAFVAFTMLIRAPGKAIRQAGMVVTEAATTMAEGITGAFKVTINANTIIGSTIERVRSEAKLIVLTANVEVDLEKSSEKKVLWDYLNLGTTTTRVRAMDNQVQYYVDLAKFSRSNISFEPEKRTVVVTVPEPVLDEAFVDVQSDPAKIQVQTTTGWARLASYSGKHLEDQARRELRLEVIRAGDHELLREKARQAAVEKLSVLLDELRVSLDEGVTLEIRFQERGTSLEASSSQEFPA